MTIPMNLPTLGSTGVVQNPGDIGALGNALSGLPAIIQANMQLEAQKQRDAQNQLYLQAQMDQMRFQQEEANRRTQQAQAEAGAAGQFLGQITRPDVPVGGGLMPFQFDLPAMSPERAIQDVRTDLRSAVLESTKDTIKTVREEREKKRGEQEQAKMAKAVDAYLANPDALPQLIRTVPPSQIKTFVDQVNTLKPDKGSWEIREQVTPEGRKYVGINAEKNITRPFNITAPEPKATNITVNNLPEAVLRNTGLAVGATQGLAVVNDLLQGGYDPLKENWTAKAAGTAKGIPGLKSLGELVEDAQLTPQGRQFRDGSMQIIRSNLYAVSGAAQGDPEVERAIRLVTRSLFTDRATMQQKLATLQGMAVTVQMMANQGPGVMVDKKNLPKTWDDFATLINSSIQRGANPNAYVPRTP